MIDIPLSFLYRLFTFRWDHKFKISDKAVISGSEELEYGQIKARPELNKGFFWTNIIFPSTKNGSIKIPGIRKNEAPGFLDSIISGIQDYHQQTLAPYYNQIPANYHAFKRIFNGNYVRHSSIETWKQKNEDICQKLDNEFALENLLDSKSKKVRKFILLLTQAHALRGAENQKFISRELQKYGEFFDTVENNPLTESQRMACVVNEDNNLVLAGAGSGKTSVIIAKTGYLIQSGLAKSHEILILAYGRKTSKETNERIKAKLPNIEGVKTSTFHKLGLDIIGTATGKKPQVSKLQEDPSEFNALINRIITELTQKDSAYNQRVIDYFVTHLFPHKSEFDYKEQGEYFAAMKEGDVRSLKSRLQWAEKRNGMISLKQEQVKSFEEVVIADFLFVNGIEYQYEVPYKFDTATADKSQYRPDFYLPDYDIYIEHFGINRNGKTAPFVNQVKYEDGMNWKRRLHREKQTALIETFSYEMQEGVLTDLLYTKLENKGVRFFPMSFENLLALLHKIKKETKATELTKLIVNFLDLFKQSGHSFESIREKASQHPKKSRYHAFLDIFEPILAEYTAELNFSNSVDFNDMIRKATDYVRSGEYKPRFKYILVDEFQDISAIRADLVKALIDKGDDTVLSCVGDDWQSIYRFSGSDINYTRNFEQHFGHTGRVLLDKTFRYNDKVNAFSKTFIAENPAQLKKAITANSTISENGITLVGYYQDKGNAVHQCLEQIRVMHPDPATVYILGRYGFTKPDHFETLRTQYPEYSIQFDTVHGSKGKEADFVIIVDVNDAKYGFPSRINDDPLLDLVLPPEEPFKYAEERRLFYVAVTRTKNHTFILYEVDAQSAFIKEIAGNKVKYHFNEFLTKGAESAPPDYGKCPVCGTGKITMRVMPDGSFFFSCGNFPFCTHTPRTCDSCNKAPMTKEGTYYYCQNPKCNHTAKACGLCSDGIMVERKGKYGRFLGCSNFGGTDCRYKEKLH
ncbi:UvrD-helicase domain-containing protein [Desulfobacter postgatei]|uniref:UvrD-helicase domain-containing protein n=1 Tax=Desulfobacter postgatei TaxID=2293 RepID=UPI00259B88FB|nr:UvrD-helicase domain-containing protein [uncultured Desulfobacter sp.]